jgi:hypothetical protein
MSENSANLVTLVSSHVDAKNELLFGADICSVDLIDFFRIFQLWAVKFYAV